MPTRDYDPSQGYAFQGDISIVPVPDTIAIATTDEIAPVAGRLILQEGEVTGHHHAIRLPQPVRFRDDGAGAGSGASPRIDTADPVLAAAFAAQPKVGTARMYRDQRAAEAMVRAGVLTRPDLVVGFLHVQGGPVTVTHEEHDGIRLPEGRYAIGRQVESAGAEERMVQD